ncbi:hypothetical protein STEG23_011640, partial [Scotinomys teguina]
QLSSKPTLCSDYNWQQRVELTLDSVLDLSVTITRKECEEKSTQCLTIASKQGTVSSDDSHCSIQEPHLSSSQFCLYPSTGHADCALAWTPSVEPQATGIDN